VENCSRMLKNSERFYGIAEKEMLSVLFCINKWRVYLCNEFIVVSDQKALNYLLSTKSPNVRLCRWFIELQAFNFKLKNRKGIENKNADHVHPVENSKNLNSEILKSTEADTDLYDKDNTGQHSISHYINLALRGKNNVKEVDQDDDLNSRNIDHYEDEGLVYYLRNGKTQGGVPKKQHKRILYSAKHFKIEENKLLYRKNIESKNFLSYSPKNARLDLVISYHSHGHFSVEATHWRLLERYFWPRMLKDIEFAINN
jgi:hypothetical protein